MVGLHSGALTHIEKIQQIFYIYIDRVASELLRSLSEAALLSSENKYRSLMELAGDALFVADVEPGSITDCNAKACQLIGKDKQDIIGLHQTQLHPAEKREEYGQLFQQVASAGRTRVSDVLVLHSDGHTIPVDISVNTFDLDGKIVEEVLDKIIRPELWKDSGDIEVVDLKEENGSTKVFVLFGGACHASSFAATATLDFVEKSLRDALSNTIKVLAI